ncbi:MAG: hypothetical protein ACW99G_19875 [Candidatus Thorarchaeota archaeon]|jgi:hypothetical protein
MANKDLPYGLRAAKHLNGMPWNGSTMKMYVGSGTAVRYVGEPVIYDGDSCPRGCCPQVDLAGTGVTVEICGAVASYDPGIDDGGTVWRQASTVRYANVVVDPDVVFMAQGDSTAVINVTDIGSNIEQIQTAHTGAARLGLSCMEIKGGSAVQDKTEQLWLMGFVDRSDNDITAVNADWYVLINSHMFGRTSGALGVVLGI